MSDGGGEAEACGDGGETRADDGEACGELDLTPLEKTAERAGLGSLRAVVVEPNPRRDAWFRWDANELSVSRRVIERLRPDDACVLLLNEVLTRRRRRALRPLAILALLLSLGVAVMLMLFLLREDIELWMVLATVALDVFVVGVTAITVAAAQQGGDDDTVAWLGEADTLCRAFNTMDQDRLELAGKRVKTRPDLHRRAERLAEKHQLRLSPELRTVSPPERRGPDVLQ
ncbi:MAG: hypothetical protein DHS20C15_02940 [Planctomycetota bacterium]|nr:MAG: hypothetical protein DHS20C15_02940 [Planctomycetota bacterium]